MDSITLLELLEDEFVDRKGYPKRKIDFNRCMQILSELKHSLPDCIRDAQKIVQNEQRILQNADTVAKNTISTAEQKARHLASDSEVGQLARAEADKMLNKAKMRCDVLIDKTKTHLEEMFDETERFLMGLVNMIRKNRQELRSVTFN